MLLTELLQVLSEQDGGKKVASQPFWSPRFSHPVSRRGLLTFGLTQVTRTGTPNRENMPPSLPLGDVSSLVCDAGGGLPHCFHFLTKT